MKTFILLLTALIILNTQIEFCNAQLVNHNFGTNDFSQTDPSKSTESIVVGDFFSAVDFPKAALNINTNYLNSLNYSISYSSFGEVFRTDAPNGTIDANIFSFWRMYTGSQSNEVEHLAIFNSHSWSIIPSYYNDINFRASSGNMFFWTENQSDIRTQKRMMINNDNPSNLNINGVTLANAVDPNWNTNGYIGIGYNTNGMWDVDAGGTGPWSMFHIEGSNNTPWNGDGWRSWMRTGTFTKENSDHVYLGMKNESHDGGNRSDAVLSWGDDEMSADDQLADCFRMVFTGNAGNGNGNSVGNLNDPWDYNGREVMRMTPQGRMGVGPLFSFNVQPARRLEILDMQDINLTSLNEPQLRLSYTQATPGSTTTTGIWTDFQSTSAGNLYINPKIGNTNGNVGINTLNPGNTLEINSNFTNNSGVRFTDLTSSSPTTPTTHNKVLTVSLLGDVILTDDKVGTGSISACSTATAADENYITKWTDINIISGIREICKTESIYESSSSPNTVGIGVGTSVNLSFQLHMRGDFLIENNTGSNNGDIYMKDISANRRVFAMYGNSGNSTIAIGPGAGGTSTSTTATNNVYVGTSSGLLTTDETRNTFVGARSGEDYSATSADGYNTFIGTLSGGDFITGVKNTAIGEISGRLFTSGDRNTFIGSEAGNSGLDAGDDNIYLGVATAIGGTTGTPITFADRNIIIGNGATGFTTTGTLTNAVTIGFANRVDCDNCVTMAIEYSNDVTEQQVGIGISNPTGVVPPMGTGAGGLAKLYVSGWNNGGSPANMISAYFTGDIYSTASFVPSDIDLKDNIQPYTDASSIINALEAKTYVFKQSNYPSMNLPNGNQIGFLAEDIAAVAPQLVQGFSNPAKLDSAGNIEVAQVDFVGVNYAGLVPILFTAIKQQKALLDSLALVVSNCCTNPQPLINNDGNPSIKSSIALSNKETIILNQNAPNPFADKTEISYNIPESVKEAVIMFYDQTGKVLHKFEISHRGQGSLTVYGEDLSSGIYSYTLIIDGENHQTKRMVKQ